MSHLFKKTSIQSATLITTGIFAITGMILFLMGRVLYCTCGYIKLWQSETFSSENSQHISDFYTFSHLIHGFLFYWFFTKLFPKSSVGFRMVLSIALEALWEVVENTPMIINRYRDTTLALDYTGDSIINSLFDILACLLGFWMARKLPVWVSILLVVLMELVVGYLIRDNLTLNVIMLIHSFQFIKNWQMQSVAL